MLKSAIAATALVVSTVVAQTPAPPPQPPPAAGDAQTPAGRGRVPGVFPAQQRPPGDPAIVARGKALFGVTCALCHGADLRGGQLNGPNLLRSPLVLNDKAGELIAPVIRDGRPEKGMPPMPMPDQDATAIAEFIHSMTALSPRQGMPPPSDTPVVLDVLVGNATAGAAYFTATCGACHSATGDLQGIATRIPDAKALQNLWVSGGAAGGRPSTGSGPAARGAAAPPTGRGQAPNPRAITVTVTPLRGDKVQGRLLRIDDFLVSLVLADGTVRSFGRNGAMPKVEIRDPLETHHKLLAVYTDKDMHDVTAYLATLK